jgi:hypothetical protein
MRCKEQHPDDDPFEITVITVQKTGEPIVDVNADWEDLPLAVRSGLDFRRRREGKGKGGKKKKGRAEGEKGSYYNDFILESIDGGEHAVAYTADPEGANRKAQLRARKELMKQSSGPVKVLLRKYASVEAVPAADWLQLSLDDLLVSTDIRATPKLVRDGYMNALMQECPKEQEAAEQYVQARCIGQQKGTILCPSERSGTYLVFATLTGNPSGDKYYLVRSNGNGKHS